MTRQTGDNIDELVPDGGPDVATGMSALAVLSQLEQTEYDGLQS